MGRSRGDRTGALRALTLTAVGLAATLGLSASASAPVSAATPVDDFALLDHNGAHHRLRYHADASAIVIFIQGNGCPIARNALPALRTVRERFAGGGTVFWMLNANPQDDRSAVAQEASEFGIDFPILIDQTQLVAEALGVTRTAEAIVIDPRDWTIAYRGPIDDRMSYETQRPARETYLEDALAALMEGNAIAVRRE